LLQVEDRRAAGTEGEELPFNSFPVAVRRREVVDRFFEADFQFFPSCCLCKLDEVAQSLPRDQDPFNSFPVAALAGTYAVKPIVYQLFQFFPSCCHSLSYAS